MTTQLGEAVLGRITPAMESVSRDERIPAEQVRSEVASGRAVLPVNPAHTRLKPVAVGAGFRTKINANIGCSAGRSSVDEELGKMRIALDAGADFVMDLSVGSCSSETRRAMLAACPAPLGTVPIYEVFSRAGGDVRRIDEELFVSVVREQAEEGVDFMTLHAGLLQAHVDMALGRTMGIVSRGGAILAEWMKVTGRENPLYSGWDRFLDICSEHDVTVSLGDGLRPGCLADASDQAQFAELDVLGELVKRCRQRHVQVMVEGPGHIPLDQIQMNVEREARVCDNAPFYVLGPVVTDVAAGHDHISSCIGAALAAYHGAALLCYVTPAEHLGLPTADDVRAGVVAYRIAAHSADVARKRPGAREWDDSMSRARADFNWDRQFELAMDPDTARAKYAKARVAGDTEQDHCSMCGRDFCAVRTSKRLSENRGHH